ncbi:amino acid adenylation domain-containing protein [Streptomyces sp. Ncost-T6T-1]|uniref:non-ribosomal peptide synthetase n=1 Tax=Streptomyces sp. Ncost-T6T-1 TaxID=1100828 RepID=UPI000805DE2A|nr:non-ribosomal peptide synthetase [Streptomyces sp. Ncost-T6T-1]SBU91164.1 amino acid adenylation domain-containing protein [Streptomyces sp. Ncost-T6T-1]
MSGTAASVIKFFEQQAANRPEAIAVRGSDGELTYAELDRRANRLAHELRARGVDAEVPVALLMRRSADLIVTLAAVLKAGGVYLALDHRLPSDRRATILLDARPALVVTDDDKPPTMDGDTPWCPLPELSACAARRPATRPEPRTSSESTAYIAYTSGSAGRPKGVMVPHRAIERLVVGAGCLPIGPDDVFLQLAPIAFDASTLEIWGPLLNGGTLVVAPEHPLSLGTIVDLVRDEGVTILWLTAGLFHHLVASGLATRLRGLRTLLAGGDVLSVASVNDALADLTGTTLINGYGPTENTTFTCCAALDEPVTASRVPIGPAIGGTSVHVLDDALGIVPDGQVGRIHASGAGLAHGYLNDPALTAQRFVANPFSAVPGGRMYRTGDLGSRGEDGALDFLGREDRQVKIRGFRIEPGDVEHALRAHPDVLDAAVVATSSGDERSLVGFYAADEPLLSEDLRTHLGTLVPPYMIPAALVWVDALPLTVNGKVDRDALTAYAPPGRGDLSSDHRDPGNPLEQWLAEMWGDLTQMSPVGVDDDFFELGGHSLMAVRIIVEISARTGVEIDPQDFYARPTISELAGLISDGVHAQAARGARGAGDVDQRPSHDLHE